MELPFELDFKKLLIKAAQQNQTSIELSPECSFDLHYIITAISSNSVNNKDNFASKVMPVLIDASGKPMPGILRGHSTFVGMIKECEEIEFSYTETARKFKGQYTRVVINQGFQNYSECPKQQAFYSWDLCLPYSCSQPDLQKFFRGCEFKF